MSKYCSYELFSNNGIVQFIKSNGSQGNCSYLNKQSTVIKLDALCEYLEKCILKKYENAAHQVGHETAEDGYQLTTLTFYDIFTDYEYILDLDNDAEEKVYEDIISKIEDRTPFVRKHPYGPPSGAQDGIDKWNEFSDIIKKKKRYTMMFDVSTTPKVEESEVEGFLQDMSDILEEDKMLRVLNKREKVYRARIDNDKSINKSNKLSSPPAKFSNHNRFNPQGISFFYGALDIDTCIAEIRPNLAENISIGCFQLKEDLVLADFVNGLGNYKDIYDEEYDFYFEEFYKPFLNEFIQDISKPIRPDDSKLDYIPTQAFVECLRFVLDMNIDGMVFKSSTNEGGENVVLFRGEDIIGKHDSWLKGVSIDKKLVKKISYSVK